MTTPAVVTDRVAAAEAAHRLGRETYAKRIDADFFDEAAGNRTLHATGHGVCIRQSAPLLPYMGREAYDAPGPRLTLDLTAADLADVAPEVDLPDDLTDPQWRAERIAAFKAASGADLVRVAFPDGIRARADYYGVKVTTETAQRGILRRRKTVVLAERPAR